MRQHGGPNIHLYIERLILEGLPIDRTHAPRVQAAMETELRRLLIGNGLATDLQSGGALASVRANAVQLRPGSSPAQIGTQIARSVYSGVGQPK